VAPASATDYSYDYANRLISRVSSNGATYTASYKTSQNVETGQLQWEEDESGGRTEYTYDKAGRIETSVRKGVSGVTGDLKTTFTYDADSRIRTQSISAAPSSSQPLPPSEQLVTARSYDSAGRLWTETFPVSARPLMRTTR
jgi:uncharacterized protein RhaS with RHS repeats